MGALQRLSLIASVVVLSTGCAGHGALPAARPDGTIRSGQVANGSNRTTLTYINLPAPYSFPWGFLNAPDGALYFGEWASGTDGGIGRLNADGSIGETDLGPINTTPIPGTFDGAGNLWFSNCGGFLCAGADSFAFLAPNGLVTTYAAASGSRPRFSAMDPNGNAWFPLARADEVARVSPTGAVTLFPLPLGAYNRANPNDIVAGPDGAFWITDVIGNEIVRMSYDGTVTNVYPIPTAEAGPRFIANGTDGNLWISELGSANYGDPGLTPPQIVKMTTTGQMTAYPLPSQSCSPDSIRPASDGFVFTDLGCNAVGLIDYNGNVVELPIVYDGGQYGNVQFSLQGTDGSYYFADDDANRIGKITLGKKGMIFPQTFSLTAGGTQLVGVGVLGDRGPYVASTDNTNVATVAPISGFPMNFTVTAVAPGTTTLTIKGKGKAMTAVVTVTAPITNARLRMSGARRITVL